MSTTQQPPTTPRPALACDAAEARALLAAAGSGEAVVIRRPCVEAMGMGVGDSPAASVHPDGSGKGWIAWWPRRVSAVETAKFYPGDEGFRCPYGKPGDVLDVAGVLGLTLTVTAVTVARSDAGAWAWGIEVRPARKGLER